MADGTSGANGQTVEELVLNLVSNFETKLKSDMSHYSRFSSGISNISRTMEGSINTMYKQVSNNLAGMVSKAQSSILSSTNSTRAAMRQVQSDGDKIYREQMKSIDNLISAQKRIAAIFSSDQSGDVKALAITAQMEKAEADVIKSASSMNVKLGKMAQDSSDILVRGAKNSVTAIRKTVENLEAEIKTAQNRIRKNGAIEDVSTGTKKISEAKEQLAVVEKAVKEQAKRLVDAEKQVQQARTAMLQQTNLKMAQSNEAYYKKTLQNLKEVDAQYRMSEEQVAQLQNKIRSLSTTTMRGAEKTKEKIHLEIDEKQFKMNYELILDNLRNSYTLAAKGMSASFTRSVASGAELRNVLAENIQRVYELLAAAKELQSTGMIDTTKEQEALKDVLKSFDKFKNEFKEVKAVASTILPVEDIKTRAIELENILNNLKSKIVSLSKNGMPNLTTGGNIENIKIAQDRLTKIETLEKEFIGKKQKIEKEITEIEKEAQKARLSMVTETNNEKRQQLNEYQTLLEQQIRDLRKSTSQIALPDTGTLRANIKASAEAMVRDITTAFNKLKTPDNFKKELKSQIDNLNKEFDSINRRKFITGRTVMDFKTKAESMKASVIEFQNKVIKLQQDIRKLSDLNKRGLGGVDTTAQIEQMKKAHEQMKSFMMESSRMAKKATIELETVTTKSRKSMLSVGWEAIRNFRWQVAAVIYLATQAARFVKKIFTGVLNEIQQYRKDSMSIASSMLFSMLGDTSKAYKTAYSYSRNLMNQMELQAARTILTMEDMTMLVKTFTQAGMIPDPQKDLSKIATIGTAIKALTEGMANAGVQMRQELYAVIQGRQRATDQLAMMFKMMGIDIKKTLADAKRNGKNMIDALSESLKPFAQMNKELSDEYATQVNQLGVIWSRMKRIGAENSLELFAQNIKDINESLFNIVDGTLTKRGEMFAHVIGNIIESIRLLLDNIVSLTSSIGSIFTTSKNNVDQIYNGFYAINQIMGVLVSAAQLFLGRLKNIFTMVTSIGKALRGDFSGAFADVAGIPKSVFDDLYRFGDRFDSIKMSSMRLRGSIEETVQAVDKLDESIWRLPHIDLFEDAQKLQKQIESATSGSFDGIKKIEYDFKIKMDDYSDLKIRTKEVLDYMTARYNEYLKSGEKFTAEQEEAIQQAFSGHMELLEMVYSYEKSLQDKRAKDISDYTKKVNAETANQKAAYEHLLESMNVKPKTRIDELDKRFKNLAIEVEKMGVTNGYAKDKMDALNKALNDFLQMGIDEVAKENAEEFERLVAALEIKGTANEFEKIEAKFEKMKLNMEKMVNLTDEQRKKYIDLLAIAEKIAIEKEKEALQIKRINEQLKIQNEISASIDSYAETLATSSSPRMKRFAEEIKLREKYNRDIKALEADLAEFKAKKIKGAHGIATEEQQKMMDQYEDAVKEHLKNLGILYELNLRDIQEPFWKKMKDLTLDWVDGFSDALADATMDFDNFGTSLGNSIAELSKNIQKQLLSAVFQEYLINPIKDRLISKGGAILGEAGKKNPAEASTMTIWEKVTGEIRTGWIKMEGWFSKVLTGLKDGVKGILESMKGFFAGMFDGGGITSYSDNGAGGIMGVISNLAGSFISKGGIDTVKSSVNKLMSDGGFNLSGNPVKGPVDASRYSLGGETKPSYTDSNYNLGRDYSMFDYAMAGGGKITEPVIGRGLRSGDSYLLGENGNEHVVPDSEYNLMKQGAASFQLSIPINVNGTGFDNSFVSELRSDLEQVVIDKLKKYAGI